MIGCLRTRITSRSGLKVIKPFYMLNSAELEIPIAHKTKMQEISICLDCKHLDVVDIMHINVETPTHLSCSKTFKS